MSPEAVALIRYFVFETQCIGIFMTVFAVVGLICWGLMFAAIRTAPVCDVDDYPIPTGVSDIRP